MTTEEMASEFASVSGKYLITDLIVSLNEMQAKEPSFAMAAAADSVLAFEALVKAHTNAKEEHIQLACQLFSAAVFNSSTNTVASINYIEEE